MFRDLPERRAWLERVPDTIRELQIRWSLTLAEPFHGQDGSGSWVAPATREDGTAAVLKLGMPHMEGADEIEALRELDGHPTVRLLEGDASLNAMLLERCDPGTPLRELPEEEQDTVLTGLLKRIWRTRPAPGPFRPLASMLASWAEETRGAAPRWPDPGLVRDGLRLFEELSRPAPDDVLLATDLHAGNVLRARREPWLAIDPKPFVGDRAYDATQHLLNCKPRLLANPGATIGRVAGLLEVEAARVRLWTFARAAADPRRNWSEAALSLARALA